MKIQFKVINDSGEEVWSSFAQPLVSAQGAGNYVSETIESVVEDGLLLGRCPECDIIVDGNHYCAKCDKLIRQYPDPKEEILSPMNWQRDFIF